MIYITGDCHAEFQKFSTKRFPEQKVMTRDDYVIVCGDFGIWHDTATEKHWLKWLSKKNFTILFVDGNHENFDRLYGDEFEVVDFHGGKAHKICDNIYHLMRGYIFDIEGKKFLAMGGASSHDIDDGILDTSDYSDPKEFANVLNLWLKQGKRFRVNHFSWWKEELPSVEEMELAEKNLINSDYKVDYVITHCLPQSVVTACGFYGSDTLTTFFENLLNKGLQFNKWYCGHYHFESEVLNKFVVKYHKIERIT